MVLSMDRWKGKVAIVTGASAGIGAVIAEELVKLGLKVVGIGRRKNLLDALADKFKNLDGKFYPMLADITNEDEILQTFFWITSNLGPVSILINNAGIVLENTLIDGDTEKWVKIMNTNVLGLCVATREAVKDMRTNGTDGHIIHINAVGGHVIPQKFSLGIACPSKFAVTALTETLRQELNHINSKIKITSISPSLVDTGILENAAELVATSSLDIEKVPKLKPKDLADAVVYVLSTPPHVQIHELMLRPVGDIY